MAHEIEVQRCTLCSKENGCASYFNYLSHRTAVESEQKFQGKRWRASSRLDIRALFFGKLRKKREWLQQGRGLELSGYKVSYVAVNKAVMCLGGRRVVGLKRLSHLVPLSPCPAAPRIFIPRRRPLLWCWVTLRSLASIPPDTRLRQMIHSAAGSPEMGNWFQTQFATGVLLEWHQLFRSRNRVLTKTVWSSRWNKQWICKGLAKHFKVNCIQLYALLPWDEICSATDSVRQAATSHSSNCNPIVSFLPEPCTTYI